jgi:hypothetical protein
VKNNNGRVADSAFQMIDHGAAYARELSQLVLGNAPLLSDFPEGSNERAGKLL